MRKQQFKRPEPGFSMYEGRTRGKRMKYTYSDDEDEFYTEDSTRRSTRNTRNHTPAELSGPVVTASGRQVRAPTRLNAETASNGAASASASVQGDAQYAEDMEMSHEASLGPGGRPRRSAALNHGTNGWTTSSKKRKSEEYESDEDDDSEPDFGDDEEEEHVPDESEDDEEEFEEAQLDEDNDLEDTAAPHLVVKLSVKKAVGKDGKEKLVPSVTLPPKHASRPTHTHRNIIMSDDEESDADVKVGGASVVARPEEKPAEESISVAHVTPKENVPPSSTTVKPALTPSTSLAFRGSPEKPPLVPRPIDVGGRK
jgi:hypothetical protein